MSHWYTQGQLGAERRGDLDREAAGEALRTLARADDGRRSGLLRPRFGWLDRLLGEVRRVATVRRHAVSVVVEPPIPAPLPVAPGVHR
jgi:hypothetical protein